jgi:hypothetical protein
MIGFVDLDALRDVDEGAVLDEGLVEGGELGRAELLGLGHEVLRRSSGCRARASESVETTTPFAASSAESGVAGERPFEKESVAAVSTGSAGGNSAGDGGAGA